MNPRYHLYASLAQQICPGSASFDEPVKVWDKVQEQKQEVHLLRN